MIYEVERIFLIDEDGNAAQTTEQLHLIEGDSATAAALAFVEQDAARLLGTVCDAPGDQCTATAWREGRAYVITVWPSGQRPEPPATSLRSN